jgi:hypothetical protein
VVVRFPEFRPRTLIRSAAHNQIVNTLFNGTVGQSLALLVTGVADAVNAAATFRNRAAGAAHIRAQHSQTGATVFEVTDSGLHTAGGGLGFDVKAFGATGTGSGNDAPGIDAAVAAAKAAGGGTVYFPAGVYLYNGAGILNRPPQPPDPLCDSPILLKGDGPGVSRLQFTALTNPEAIRLESGMPAGGPGSLVNLGQGVVDLAINCPVDKDAIAIAHVEHWQIKNVVINGCRTGVQIYNTRFGKMDHCYIFQYRGAGIQVNKGSYGGAASPVLDNTWLSDVQISGAAATTGWGFEMDMGADPFGNNAIYLDRVAINHSSHGGFLFSTTTPQPNVNAFYAFLTDCVADSFNFTQPAFRIKNGRFVYMTDCWAFVGIPNNAAVDFDGATYCSWIGGEAANGVNAIPAVEGGGGARWIFDMRNACENLTIKPSHTIGDASVAVGFHSTVGTAPKNVNLDAGFYQGFSTLYAPGRLLSAADVGHVQRAAHFVTSSSKGAGTALAVIDETGTGQKFLRINATNGLETLNSAGTTVLSTLDNSGNVLYAGQVRGTSIVGARQYSAATALVPANFALSAGWGSTATVGTIVGGDDHFSFRVTCQGASISGGPTITITFADGAWSSPPVVSVTRIGGDQPAIGHTLNSVTATQIVIQWGGLPVTANFYAFAVQCTGR